MSTDPNVTYPTGETPAEPLTPPAASEPTAPAETSGTDDVLASGDEDAGFFARHSALITAVMAAIVVAAGAVAGLWLWRNHQNDENAKTEAAFSKSVEDQGASVDTVECDGGTCSAIIGGQAYSVLVQVDDEGKQRFGVSAYAGD